MSDILDRAMAHYSEIQPGKIEVPEWGEGKKALVITFTECTVGERRKIFKPNKTGGEPDPHLAAVRAVMIKACDAEGNRLFGDMDEHKLMNKVSSSVIERIASAILQQLKLDDEFEDHVEQEKND